MKPLIKWAGGKSKLLDRLKPFYNGQRYIDPFCGSLALPLSLEVKEAVFNDINECLINMYQVVKDNCSDLIKQINILTEPNKNKKHYYNLLRKEYNDMKSGQIELNKVRLAGLFLYLNKRCFNGLYRENKSGQFNVPYRYYNTDIVDIDNLIKVSQYFNNNKITFCSVNYDQIDYQENDFIYFDPPYYQINKSFIAYYRKPFTNEDQQKLAQFIKLTIPKCNFVLSNAPYPELIELYSGYNQICFKIGRNMRSGRGKSRIDQQEFNEIIITNIN